jgi:hypothetical protein
MWIFLGTSAPSGSFILEPNLKELKKTCERFLYNLIFYHRVNINTMQNWYDFFLAEKRWWTINYGVRVMVFNPNFNNISVISCMTVSFIGGGNRCIRRKPPTCHKLLTNFIT